MDMTATQILTRARAHLTDPLNWIQSRMWNRVDDEWTSLHTCAVGALYVAVDGTNPGQWRPVADSFADREGAAHYLKQALGMTGRSSSCWHIEIWNDAPGRTHAEVLAAFDRAIELALADSLEPFPPIIIEDFVGIHAHTPEPAHNG